MPRDNCFQDGEESPLGFGKKWCRYIGQTGRSRFEEICKEVEQESAATSKRHEEGNPEKSVEVLHACIVASGYQLSVCRQTKSDPRNV
jgi:hypothetical protein